MQAITKVIGDLNQGDQIVPHLVLRNAWSGVIGKKLCSSVSIVEMKIINDQEFDVILEVDTLNELGTARMISFSMGGKKWVSGNF